jgi:hypothetical protein
MDYLEKQQQAQSLANKYSESFAIIEFIPLDKKSKKWIGLQCSNGRKLNESQPTNCKEYSEIVKEIFTPLTA